MECPFCNNQLEFNSQISEIPYFGKCEIFSMLCNKCNFKKSDISFLEINDPLRIELEIENERDMNIRVIKSSTSNIFFPDLEMELRSGPASQGEITNVEGLLNHFKDVLNSVHLKDNHKAKDLLTKIEKIRQGKLKTKLVIEDNFGNAAIVSEKSKITKIKNVE